MARRCLLVGLLLLVGRSVQAQVPAGFEVVVNTNTGGYGSSATVEMDASGHFVVGWAVYDGIEAPDHGAFIRRYQADGTPAAPRFLLNRFTTGLQAEVSVSADARGEFVPILLAQSLDILGRGEEARAARREGIARAERLLALNPLDVRVLSLGANALCDDGQAARAMEWSRRALDHQPDDPCVQLNAVCLYAHLGLKEEALTLLERAFARGCGKRDWVEHDPDYDSLRAEPRFQALLARLK